MSRLASALTLAGLLVVPAGLLPDLAPSVYAQEPVFEIPEEESPRAVVEIDSAARSAELEDGAWTFRFLVPTAIVLSTIIVIVVVGAYGFGVRGRYRVNR
jgi:nitrate reductase NapE component